MRSEAASQFIEAKEQIANSQKQQNLNLMSKLKSTQFSLKEQNRGGHVNNYFQTSHNNTFSSLGNPNAIRSRISEGVLADNRSQHYHLGFEKNSFAARGAANTFGRSVNVTRNLQGKS